MSNSYLNENIWVISCKKYCSKTAVYTSVQQVNLDKLLNGCNKTTF